MATAAVGRPASSLARWEVGVIAVMALLCLAGIAINPFSWGNADALFSALRDAARFGVMAVGMTFVIVNRDLDLSVVSTFGLTAVVFLIAVAPSGYDLSPGPGSRCASRSGPPSA